MQLRGVTNVMLRGKNIVD